MDPISSWPPRVVGYVVDQTPVRDTGNTLGSLGAAAIKTQRLVQEIY